MCLAAPIAAGSQAYHLQLRKEIYQLNIIRLKKSQWAGGIQVQASGRSPKKGQILWDLQGQIQGKIADFMGISHTFWNKFH